MKNSKIKNRNWNRKVAAKGILVLLMFLLSVTTVYAHRMMIDPLEDSTIWIGYEDGTTVENMSVEVRDDQGEILVEDTADEDGYYSFENISEAHSITADDGMGHRVTWVVGEPAAIRGGWGRYIRIIGITGMFILIALYFQRRIRNKASGQERSS